MITFILLKISINKLYITMVTTVKFIERGTADDIHGYRKRWTGFETAIT